MLNNYSSDTVIALAPDAASTKAASKLSTTAKWQLLCYRERALWGLCKGSGTHPYQTCIDLQGPAFNCSCPSRKHPCKHALALFQLALAQIDHFDSGQEPPDWVSDWLDKRDRAGARKVSSKPVDKEAQAKRQAKREANMDEGLELISKWLDDCFAIGLANIQAHASLEQLAARMVDAQAGGLARRLRQLEVYLRRADYPKALHALSDLNLLIEAAKKRDALDTSLASEIKQQLGISMSKEQLLEQPEIEDRWWVLGADLREEESLVFHTVWLFGEKTRRFACIRNSTHQTQKGELPLAWRAPSILQGTLRYFPSHQPLRSQLEPQGEISQYARLPEYKTLTENSRSCRERLAENPWLDEYPMLINKGRLRFMDGQLFLCDQDLHALPLLLSDEQVLYLLAEAYSQEVSLFGTWDQYDLRPLTLSSEQGVISLGALS